jgi:hypothetical protein
MRFFFFWLTSYRISLYVHRVTVALDQSHWHTHTNTHVCTNTLGRTTPDEGTARHRDLYLTPHNTPNRHINASVGFEHPIPASEGPQTNALEYVATGIGKGIYTLNFCFWLHWKIWSTIKRNAVPVLCCVLFWNGTVSWYSVTYTSALGREGKYSYVMMFALYQKHSQ